MKHQLLLLLAFGGLLAICKAQGTKRNLGLFSVIKFDNRECETSDNKQGICYTEEECENKGGKSSGSCAEGYGVCCSFTMNCGGSKSENLTYFESNSAMTGACNAKVCKCSNDICQLRLDLLSFVISGPSTDTEDSHESLGGSNSNSGETGTMVGVCDKDSFVVTGDYKGTPVICGTNTGYHMFVDASERCNTLSFNLAQGVSISRQWEIKVTQYTCGSLNRAPDGCLQYFYGSNSGFLETFNWANKVHLSEQNQLMCIRQEEGMCRICFSHDTEDFGISSYSGNTDSGYVGSSSLCGNYYSSGTYLSVFDFIHIGNPSTKTSSKPVSSANGHFCGGNLVTSGSSSTVATVCTKMLPFKIRFMSDFGEDDDSEPDPDDRGHNGFKLHYQQFTC